MKVIRAEEFFTRHRDLISGDQLSAKIAVVGAGAIGSFVTLSLAKMGFTKITVYDFDTVEPENIGAQFFPVSAIGKKKVEALKEMVYAFTGTKIKAVDRKIEKGEEIEAEIFISAVDSMEVRRMLFETVAISKWLIDPRMGAEYANMAVVEVQNPESREDYSKTLYSDAEAVQERCTAKTTIYTVLLIAGQVAKAVKDIVTNTPHIENLEWSISKNSLLAFSKGKVL